MRKQWLRSNQVRAEITRALRIKDAYGELLDNQREVFNFDCQRLSADSNALEQEVDEHQKWGFSLDQKEVRLQRRNHTIEREREAFNRQAFSLHDRQQNLQKLHNELFDNGRKSTEIQEWMNGSGINPVDITDVDLIAAKLKFDDGYKTLIEIKEFFEKRKAAR